MRDKQTEMLIRNLGLLSNTEEEVAGLAAELSRRPVELHTRTEAGGWRNLLIESAGGWVPYHRPDRPESELTDKISFEERLDILVCLGTGFAYQFRTLLAACPADKVVFVETRLEPLVSLLSTVDLAALLPDNALVLYAPEPVRLAQILMLICRRYSETSIEFLMLDSVQAAAKGYAAETTGLLTRLWSRHRIYLNSVEEQSEYIVDHALANLPSLASGQGMRENCGADQTAFLISSGPSLDLHKPLLPALAERGCVIAVGSALEPILSAGVQPDLVVVTDPLPVNAIHFPRSGYDLDLAFDISIDPQIVNKFNGRRLALSVGNKIGQLLEPAFGMERLFSWGTVTSAALALCARAGFRDIVLIGSDLSYFGQAAHAASYGLEMKERETIEREDVTGAQVQTTAMFVQYARLLSEQAAELAVGSGVRVLNASEAGILDGIEQVQLREYLDRIWETRGPQRPWRWAGAGFGGDGGAGKLISALEAELDQSMAQLSRIDTSVNLSALFLQPLLGAVEAQVLRPAREFEAAGGGQRAGALEAFCRLLADAARNLAGKIISEANRLLEADLCKDSDGT